MESPPAEVPDRIELLYEDGPCYVVLKPAGVPTQAPPGLDSMEVRMKDYLRAREGKTGNIYLGLPHRLDRPVTGALLFARHVRACQRLARQFEHRTVRKIYWAAVAGVVEPSEGTWIDHLRKVHGIARAEVVPADQAGGREAVLHYHTLGKTDHGSLLEIRLETGRTHQIRVQAAARGFPVLGDELYGSAIPFGPAVEDFRQRQIALHGRLLGFEHPMTREPVEVVAPLDSAWQRLGLPAE